MSTPGQIEQQQRAALVRRAVEKHRTGQTLTAKEVAAWKRFERDQEERYGAQWADKVPQRVYRAWAGGRQTKQLADHERAYGVPCTGREISVPAVVRWLHDFLVARKEELSTTAGGGSLKDELARGSIEKMRLQIEKLQTEQQVQAGAVAPVAELEAWLARKAQSLRSLAEWMQKQPTLTGQEAANRLRDAIADAALEEPYGG